MSERPGIHRFDPDDLIKPADGLLWLYKSSNDGFWRVHPDADIAQQEATGYPVGELVEYERMGDYEDGERGGLLVIDVGGQPAGDGAAGGAD